MRLSDGSTNVLRLSLYSTQKRAELNESPHTIIGVSVSTSRIALITT